MHIFDKILSRDEFRDSPPIFVDIGASGAIHPKWRRLAPYAVCIAFDADDREMNCTEDESKGYRKLYVINRVVTADPQPTTQFYLTKSPYCSSTLKPLQSRLDQWAFASLFEVERVVSLQAVTLPSVLDSLAIKKVDWFKTDSQGTDLRLFKSLGDDLVKRVLLAEFEPGIIDAYEGEDKLCDVMAYMQNQPFWMSNLTVKGTQKISQVITENFLASPGYALAGRCMKRAPGWGEIAYLNSFSNDADHLDVRDFLLGWILSITEGHLGFALELCQNAVERFNDPIFIEMKRYTLHEMRGIYFRLPFRLLRKILDVIER